MIEAQKQIACYPAAKEGEYDQREVQCSLEPFSSPFPLGALPIFGSKLLWNFNFRSGTHDRLGIGSGWRAVFD